jgi:alcohol dehydrogenase (cytochrome c)
MEPQVAPGVEKVGSIHGIRTDTGRTAWKYEQRSLMLSLLATGGRLLFGGDAQGRFRAFDQDTGEVLWEVNLGSAVTGFPIAFAVDGRQYIAVSTGVAVMTALTSKLTPEIRPSAANNLFVFALPD